MYITIIIYISRGTYKHEQNESFSYLKYHFVGALFILKLQLNKIITLISTDRKYLHKNHKERSHFSPSVH